MFSFFEKFKYRSEVVPQVHAILFMIPELKTVLSGFPGLNNTINEFRKAQTPLLEAAVYVSMVVLEKLMDDVPLQTRSVVIQQLNENIDDGFRWFGKTGYGIKRGEVAHPTGMLPLTVALGFAFWYLGCAERDGKLSARAHKIFLADVGGMLLGNSSEERAKNRVGVAFDDIFRERGGTLGS
ncbi:MAG TPA: hypothetical protein VIE65_18990 [Methylobacter sp.]